MRHISLVMCRAEGNAPGKRRGQSFSREQKIMPTIFQANPKVDQLRATLGHSIVDADAHQIEMVPLFLDFLREVGGAKMPQRWRDYVVLTRRAFRMTPEERSQVRPGIPVWWPLPAENTLDRATSSLPKLMHSRMDEIGLDFAIVYPSLGLFVLTLPGMADGELRQASARAFNNYNAEMFRGFGDRMTPAAVIPMHTPGEAITELEHVVKTLGLKAAVFAADVLRPVPKPEKDPAAMAELYYYDCFGIDSPYDYDPVWRKCIELRIAPTFHSAPIGRGTRASISRHQYNQLGGFAEGGEAVCKALFFGGVTRRFPDVRFGFLEGGAGWAIAFYARLVEHWKKRNYEAMQRLDPARIDTVLLGRLIDEFGHQRLKPYRDKVVKDVVFGDRMEELDDWRECKITRPEDIRDLFMPNFFFGCEGDDRSAAAAFDRKVNPYGASLNPMFGSDIGHFDVEDMRGVLEEAHELVDHGLMSPQDFRRFALENPVRLHGGMNKDFFKGTKVEAEAEMILSADQAHRARAREPMAAQT
jgi:predicted TIM-barrel fold metal-dependent hydrolase